MDISLRELRSGPRLQRGLLARDLRLDADLGSYPTLARGMAKPEKSMSIGAAECARRTGLTVRALRVYERHGLIEPKRNGKGWRCYGPKELQQLNVIMTLKTFGMTLTQIRALLETKPPPLARVLQIQLQAWSAKRDAVERTLALVRGALARIGSGKPLSLDELCHLTRSMDAGTEQDTAHLFATVRGLINEKITPEEERAHMNWLSSRPLGELTAAHPSGSPRKES
jgi:DNA-binding transcriptional MerR regulator